MLQNIKQLYGRSLGATDGLLGHVKDFYFDDETWAIRYCVVDTGSWLAGRQVLLSPDSFETHRFGGADPDSSLRVKLSRRRIEESPVFASHQPVSRRHEEEYHRYYGLSAYWRDPERDAPHPASSTLRPLNPPFHDEPLFREGGHLCSTRVAAGFYLHGTDGQVGYVSGFMVSDSWIIREMLVETGHWYSEKTVVLRTADLGAITFNGPSVFLNLSRTDIARGTRPALGSVKW